MDLKKVALAPRETPGGVCQHPRQKMLDTLVEGGVRQLGLLLAQRADERIQVFQRLASHPSVLLNAPEVVSDAFRVRRGGCWHRGFLLNQEFWRPAVPSPSPRRPGCCRNPGPHPAAGRWRERHPRIPGYRKVEMTRRKAEMTRRMTTFLP